jgi:hypothetical protein
MCRYVCFVYMHRFFKWLRTYTVFVSMTRVILNMYVCVHVCLSVNILACVSACVYLMCTQNALIKYYVHVRM